MTGVRLVIALWMLHPGSSPAPQDVAQERTRRAQSVLASTFDASLPEIPLDVWIREVIGSSARYHWASGICEGAPNSSDVGVPVCGVVVATTPDLVATISVRLGIREFDAAADKWDTPRFDDGFLDRGKDSLTLERLGDLPKMLTVPPERWPTREVSIDESSVRCSPIDPLPLEPVTCSVAVRNLGETTVHARVSFDVPAGAATGHIAVMNPNGSVTATAAPFIVTASRK
jgi:hypothetical protein